MAVIARLFLQVGPWIRHVVPAQAVSIEVSTSPPQQTPAVARGTRRGAALTQTSLTT
jgi:hypothetical protein